jgi:signal transduction histidine kinase
VLVNVYREFALTYEATGDFRRALEYERRLTETDALAKGERAQQRTAELQERYEAERRENEIERLRTGQELQAVEMRRRRLQSLTIGAVLAVGMILLGALVFTQRTRIVTERRLRTATDGARERAEAAERLKSRLLLIASHDLKTPLASMSALAERISQSPLETEKVCEFSAGIKADAMRMSMLVRDFLDAAAIEDGRLHLHRTRIDLDELVSAAVAGRGALAARKNQRLEIAAHHTGAVTFADAERILQILDNLLGNALKFSPPGGRVEVAVGAAGPDWVYVQVTDSGPGLRPEDLMKIFKPFQSLSAKPTGGESSSGLGLFITRELLASHGGRLEVESQPGSGGVFRFLLPALKE